VEHETHILSATVPSYACGSERTTGTENHLSEFSLAPCQLPRGGRAHRRRDVTRQALHGLVTRRPCRFAVPVQHQHGPKLPACLAGWRAGGRYNGRLPGRRRRCGDRWYVAFGSTNATNESTARCFGRGGAWWWPLWGGVLPAWGPSSCAIVPEGPTHMSATV
jgi:hypothetical protein